MATIYVTNKSEKPLKDGFSGIVYEFLPGKTIEIPEEAAQHIFGYKDIRHIKNSQHRHKR